MILSMTGFGQANVELGSNNYRIEIKSLNGKTTDIRFKSMVNLKEKELELRKLILDHGQRGKFDVNLISESGSGVEDYYINKDLMANYYRELSLFAQEHKLEQGDMLQSIMRLPNIIQLTEDEIDENEWAVIRSMCIEALDKLKAFRKKEGRSLEKDLLENLELIVGLLNQVDKYEDQRIESLKERIRKNLAQHMSGDGVDENRFEQEILYYLEKLDINEEKVRLLQHCRYFEEEVKKDQNPKGKKLSFISQEMGREINTLGAKAQHTEIQQIVVQMKDHLEKVKEQVLNVL